MYLHDHLAGCKLGIELLQDLARDKANHGTALLAQALLPQIEEESVVPRKKVVHVGESEFDLKQVAAGLAEKASHFKLHDDAELGKFKLLEMRCLGIQGK